MSRDVRRTNGVQTSEKRSRGWFRSLLELFFQAAGLVVDTPRTFFLIVLALLGPWLAISVYNGFQSTLTAWIGRYVGISLWLPVSDLFGAMLSRLQTLMLSQDIEQLRDPDFIPDGSNTVYCIFSSSVSSATFHPDRGELDYPAGRRTHVSSTASMRGQCPGRLYCRNCRSCGRQCGGAYPKYRTSSILQSWSSRH